MRIAIIGAGLSGCTIGRLLKDRGHDVAIFEKEEKIGGLCATATDKGRIYQLFGSHNFHTYNQSVIKFISRFSEFNNYVHYKGVYADGGILPYPISYQTIERLKEKEQILRELSKLPKEIDMRNFETCVVSMIGKTLYAKFIENYTTKFWGILPKDMEAEWAPKRIAIRQNNSLGYFGDEWQGLPIYGYSYLLEQMTEGIAVHYNTEIKDYRDLNHDLVISTISIDKLFHFCYGCLTYRGFSFILNFNETHWENKRYGCINYPGNDVPYIRKANYSLCYQAGAGTANSYIVSYGYPDEKSRMCPLYTLENKRILNEYLLHLVKIKNLVSIGRLGLFKYYDMDEVIEWCLDNINAVENYITLGPDRRMQLLT